MATSQILTNNILNDYVRLLARREKDRTARVEINRRYYNKISVEREDMGDIERNKLEERRNKKKAYQRAYYEKNKEKILLRSKLRRLEN
tara:strand:+ start:3550 stop:3816 length:267 start_codon:yes stop_codon:yes gene_type:complete